MAAQDPRSLGHLCSTPDSYDTIRATIGYLRKQTARRRMELVIVAPSAERLGLKTGSFLTSCPIRWSRSERCARLAAGMLPGCGALRHRSLPSPKITRSPLPNGPKPLFELMARSEPPSAP